MSLGLGVISFYRNPSRNVCAKLYVGVLREADDALHVATAFLRPHLAHREHALFFKEMLKPVFDKSLIHFAWVQCDGLWLVGRRPSFPFLGGYGKKQSFLPSGRNHSRSPTCVAEFRIIFVIGSVNQRIIW